MERLWFPQLAELLQTPGLADIRLSGTPWAILSALVLAGFAWRSLRRDNIPIAKPFALCVFGAIVGGFFVGHWTALLFQPQRILEDPTTLIILGVAGFSSLGLYAGAVLGMALTARLQRAPGLLYADALAPATLLAAAWARLGCLLQGCDFGTLSPSLPWALRYPRSTAAFAWLQSQGLVGSYHRVGLPQHPFPLYEAIPVFIAGLVLTLRPHALGTQPGQRAAGAAALYCASRLFAEGVRANTPILLGHVTIMQTLCAFGLLVSVSSWLALHTKPTPSATS